MDILKLKRGLKKDLPDALEIGEPAYCWDTGELYIGDQNGRPKLLVLPKTVINGGTFDDIPEDAGNVIWGGYF